MAKKIVVCLDGTWNQAEQDAKFAGPPTNVLKLYRALDRSAEAGQVPFHQDGVGTQFGQRLRGGALGYGLFEQIKQGYDAIVARYDPGDQIYVFGFSRGAYSARSLAGFIARCGVLRRDALADVERLELSKAELALTDQDDRLDRPTATDKAFVLYKLAYDPDQRPEVERFKARYAHDTDIAMVGVWDTVGSLGLPVKGFVGAIKDRFLPLKDKLFGFLDTAISDRVKAGYHALAIDEHREPFLPTLWEGPRVNQLGSSVEQVWFAGAHSNVGGGYENTGLSDIALGWMMDRARRHGLRFTTPAPAGEPADKLNDSLQDFLGGWFSPFIRVTREIAPGSWIHRSVEARLAAQGASYRPAALQLTRDSPPRLDQARHTVVE